MGETNLQDVAVLIPSLDPDELMVQYVKGLVERGFQHIIVIDDGSCQETQLYFEQVKALGGVVVLRHAINQGKGRALKTGMHYFLNTYKKGEKVGLVTADADGQHSIEDTVKVALRLAETKNLILGTRNFSEEQVPFKSRWGNQITTNVFHLLYGKRITDTQTGLRGIPYEFVSTCLKLEGERFDYEILMLIEAVRKKIEIVEETIETIYINSNRATHFHAIKDSVRIYKLIFRTFLKFAVSGMLSFFLDISLFALLTKVLFTSRDVMISTMVGTIVARIVSSLFNFTMNKNTVFKKKGQIGKTFIKYYALCILQMLCSWLLVVVVYKQIHWDTTLIKGIVDTVLFFVSYQIQRLWVFKED